MAGGTSKPRQRNQRKMKRKLLTQMRRDWRSNLWMVLELVIVLLVLQAVFSILYFIYDLHSPAQGYDLTDVMTADLKYIDKDSPEYTPYDTVSRYVTDRDLLIARLKENPMVEEIGIGSNALPYNYNFQGVQLRPLDENPEKSYLGNVRTMSPATVRAIRLTGLNGETTEQLASMLERGQILISNLAPENDWILEPEKLLGKEAFSGDSTQAKTVGAVAYGMARSDYEPLYRGVIYYPTNGTDWYWEMIIRVKPGMCRAFAESLTASDMQLGNVYISNLRSVDHMREAAHMNIKSVVRSTLVCAAFLLTVIFLGFLGTFWFRTQQRVGEIAVRKVCGATDRNIFVRLIGEGLVLLLIGALVSVPVFFWFASSDFFSFMSGEGVNIHNAVGGSVIALVSVTLLIVAGIWLPARKATRIDPATALKDL